MTPNGQAKDIKKYGMVGALVLAIAVPFTTDWEGVRLKPYLDLIKIETVCQGLTNVEMREYTRAECDALHKDELFKYIKAVQSQVRRDMPIEMIAALASWEYNVGVNAASKSTLIKYAKAGKFKEACEQLPRWNKAGGKVVKGLVNRREAERKLCLSGLSKTGK